MLLDWADQGPLYSWKIKGNQLDYVNTKERQLFNVKTFYLYTFNIKTFYF